MEDFKILIVIPTLGREEKLARLLKLIPETADYSHYAVAVKQDVFGEGRKGVPRLLAEAVAEAESDVGAFAYFGNDVIPQPGFLREAIQCMRENFPEMDGMVGFNDGVWDHLAAAPHWLASRKLLPMLDGEFFHCGYKHIGCDLELTSRCRQAGKYAFASEARIIHDHYCVGAAFDEVYWVASNPERVDRDHDLLKERSKLLGFPIPTITRRFSEEGMRFFDAPQEVHPERLFVLRQIPNPELLTIADLGCGTHKTIPSAIGIDVMPGADVQCSLDDLPFPDGFLNVIISRHSLEHVLNTVKALREWRRVLAPEGKVVIVLPDADALPVMHPFYSANQHMHAFTQASFRDLIETTGIFRIEQLGLVVPEWSFGGVLRVV